MSTASQVQVKIIPLEFVEKHIQESLVEKNDQTLLLCCIDGRCQCGEDQPRFAIPGGAAGLLLNTIAAIKSLSSDNHRLLTNDQIKDVVVDVVGGVDKFIFHTDDDAEKEGKGPGKGCGHLNKALEFSELYMIDQADILWVFAVLDNLQTLGAKQVCLMGGA